MNASNLPQLRPRSQNTSGEQLEEEGEEGERSVLHYSGAPVVTPVLRHEEDIQSGGLVSFAGMSNSATSAVSSMGRRGSGSYKGAYESDDDIAAKGQNNGQSGYQRLPSREPSCPEEEKIKRKLKFFFMNPADKYHATRSLPWKLLLQILKVFLVTAQLWIFATYRYAHVNFYTDQTVSFQHFFLKGWDEAREIHAYPPALGKNALYRKSEFYEFVDFAVLNLARIEDDALGPFFRNSSLGLCAEHYKAANITKDLIIEMDTTMMTSCKFLSEQQIVDFNSSKEWLADFPITWPTVERIFLNFSLTSVTLNALGPEPTPDCFQFRLKIEVDNKDKDGQLPIELNMEPVRLDCPNRTAVTVSYYSQFIVFLNLGVILICVSSLLLCLRALLRAQLLKHETGSFLHRAYGWNLTVNERLEFLNLWYVMICTNDLLIIIGSIIKQLIESKSIVGDMWDVCSLMLGTGNLLVWFGLLRYLGFFKTYNVLILTMKGAAPNMLRFLICASLLYIGFAFAGWVILGPYHFKFSTLMSTSECLFSLINGDDMFATFNSIPMERALPVWVYSRVYLYFFICLFIYVVLSLFISIIMDTYEIIKNCYDKGFPPNRLQQFYSTAQYDFSSGQYSGESVHRRLGRLICGWWRTRNPVSSGYEEIN